MTVTIYHNPKCSTSRHVLEALREAGFEVNVIEYLKTPPSRAELARLAERAGLSVRDLLRRKSPRYDELGLGDGALTDDQLLAAIEDSPELLERPLVAGANKVMMVRPKDRVADFIAAERA
ncbi:MAG: arsenate reductase (glutaredoxin) [Paracoccus sp. (in: a-proteobacteria)]|nr:arsenate reductase (glutaredoxin) [Paracoccus sp. (in: a-proteobacteria)]